MRARGKAGMEAFQRPRGLGVDRRHFETLFDPPDARLKLADEDPVTDHSGVIFDHRSAQADDLVGEFLARRHEIGGNVGAERAHLASDVEISPRMSFISPRISRRTCKTRLSGSGIAKGLSCEATSCAARMEAAMPIL